MNKICTLIVLVLMTSTLMAKVTIECNTPFRYDMPMIGTNLFPYLTNYPDRWGMPFEEDLKKSKIEFVRFWIHPDPYYAHVRGLDFYNEKILKLVNSGAQMIWNMSLVANRGVDVTRYYYSLDGKIGKGDHVSNIIYLTKHFMAPPFNIQKQYWEIQNEPAICHHGCISKEAYVKKFNEIHEGLVAAGIRDNVVLCGPALAYLYGAKHKGEETLKWWDYFIDQCKHSLDVFTFHNYFTSPVETKEFDYTGKYLSLLIQKMENTEFARPNVGIGIDEYNASGNNGPRNRETMPGALVLASVHHHCYYNPMLRFSNSFVWANYIRLNTAQQFARYQRTFGHYNRHKERTPAWWIIWAEGNLKGTQVLTQSGSSDDFLVTATKDSVALYIEVVNLKKTDVEETILLSDIQMKKDSNPTLHRIAPGLTPDISEEMSAAMKDRLIKTGELKMDYPAESICIIKIPMK